MAVVKAFVMALLQSRSQKWFSVFLTVCALNACSDGSDDDDDDDDDDDSGEGTATEATCPSDSALTYDNFGQTFMEAYCTRCHSTTLTGAARNNAPDDHNFDSLAEIRATEAEHIDEQAAAGPNATNTEMPPGGPAPTLEERRKLGEWLACETP